MADSVESKTCIIKTEPIVIKDDTDIIESAPQQNPDADNIKSAPQQKPDVEQGCKMTKREKKRFKAAIAKGVPKAEAIKSAITTPRQTPKKRRWPIDTTPNSNLSKKPKNAPTQPTALSSSPKPSFVKLGFISADRASPLTANQMLQLQDAILKTTLTSKIPGLIPKFEKCFQKNDFLMLVCHNQNAAEWVRQNFKLIKATSMLNVQLLNESQLPGTHLVRGFFANSLRLSNDKILGHISIQNDIDTTHWKVLNRTIQGEIVHLAIKVDDASMQLLTKCDGKIFYCFGTMKLILKASDVGSANVKTVESPSTSAAAEFTGDIPATGTQNGGSHGRPGSHGSGGPRGSGGSRVSRGLLQSGGSRGSGATFHGSQSREDDCLWMIALRRQLEFPTMDCPSRNAGLDGGSNWGSAQTRDTYPCNGASSATYGGLESQQSQWATNTSAVRMPSIDFPSTRSAAEFDRGSTINGAYRQDPYQSQRPSTAPAVWSQMEFQAYEQQHGGGRVREEYHCSRSRKEQ